MADVRLLGRIIGYFASLDVGPLVSLDPYAEGDQDRRDHQHLHTSLLALVHLGLGSPVQELDNVLGHLRRRSGGLVLVLDQVVEQDTSHGDTGTREVGVEVEAGGYLGTSWGLVGVPGQQGEDVVGATVTSLDHQGQVWGQSTLVAGPSGLIVLVGSGEVVGELSGSLLDLALVIWLAVVLVLLGQGLGLVGGQNGTDEGSVGNSAKGVARRANFSVNLESSSEPIFDM